jgi:hypothetical protein
VISAREEAEVAVGGIQRGETLCALSRYCGWDFRVCRSVHTAGVWLATEGKDPQVFTLSLLGAPQQIESGTARLDAWEDRALLRHRLKCSSLAVQREDFGYRV